MDIFDLVNEDRRKQEERDKYNYPYGKLDYNQMADDPNLYWAILPEDIPTSLDNLIEVPVGNVLLLKNVHIMFPKIRKEIELIALIPSSNQIVANVVRGRKPVKVAWQQWEKIYINSEPVCRSKNWIGDGADSVPDLQPILIDLESENARYLDKRVEFTNVSELSDLALAVLLAMLEHNVKGAELIKGLKSKAESMYIDRDFTKFKIDANYLGGWIIKGETGSTLTTSEFVEFVDREAKSRL